MVFVALILFVAFGVSGISYLKKHYYSLHKLGEVLATPYDSVCLGADSINRPVWECYELAVDAQRFEPVTIAHESGEFVSVLAFVDDSGANVRFTPHLPGVWSIAGKAVIEIIPDRPAYAQGFVAAAGNKWIRTATNKAFLPQYVMYDRADIDYGIEEFVKGHGFTGFHLTNLRDFLANPSYFEAVILKTYRAGGVTHLWLWGDEQRQLTPEYYSGDLVELYQEICARLAPLPGWTVGYGFDLYEWVSQQELETWHRVWRQCSSYPHMAGARGPKNSYGIISTQLDYMSWEWHRPSLMDYKRHLQQAGGKPAFSEDRFRIRKSVIHRAKDYVEETTLIGLWDSLFAGGVANIWGNKGSGEYYSQPYKIKNEIKLYRQFVDRHYSQSMVVTASLFDGADCLSSTDMVACLVKDRQLIMSSMNAGRVDAINIRQSIESKPYNIQSGRLTLPERSDWVLIVPSTKMSDYGKNK